MPEQTFWQLCPGRSPRQASFSPLYPTAQAGGFYGAFHNPDIWKPIIIGIGIILTVVGYILPLRLWLPNLQGNRRALLTITVTPVLVAITVQILSLISSPFAKLPPDQNHLLASVFEFAHFLLWAILVNVLPVPRSSGSQIQIELPRSISVIGMGLVMALFFIGVLGPGLGPLEEDPRLEWFAGCLQLSLKFYCDIWR